MLKSYLRVAWRNLWKRKVFSFINVAGLALGLASCFLIFLYVRFELSYDHFNRKAGRIYRVVGDLASQSGVLHWHTTPGPLAAALKTDFPEVEEAVRLIPGSILVRKGDVKFQEEHSMWADPSVFSVFDFPLKYGDAVTALKAPNSVVLSETAARKYFGRANPVGQSLILTGNGLPGLVTGVMKDIPENSHIRADMFISMSTYLVSFAPWVATDWTVFNPSTYILLAPGANVSALNKELPAFIRKYAADGLRKAGLSYTVKTQPLRDVYMDNVYGAQVNGNMQDVDAFAIIAFFVLLIAAVNFINLTTARAVERAKEIGVRKCSGALKRQLMGQFLMESMLVVSIAWFQALLLSSVFLPLFNNLAGKTISAGIFHGFSYPLQLLGLALLTGLLAGIYPSFILSSAKVVDVLKGQFKSGNRGVYLRKALVIGQFSISIALAVATIVVYSQLRFMRNRPLGFDKNNVFVIPNNGDPGVVAFKGEIAGIPAVEGVTNSSAIPGRDYNNGNDMNWVHIRNGYGEMQRINADIYNVDQDFLRVYQIKLVAGRDFSQNPLTGDSTTVILNETAVRELHYGSDQEAIGKMFESPAFNGKIIGVVRDFHYHSLKGRVTPVCLLTGRGYWYYSSIKVASVNLPQTVRSIRDKWEKTVPDRPFGYFFLDKDFDRQYRAEDRFGNIFLYFSILALFISAFGLLGLSSYSTSQRTREIGIRKVLGASAVGIVRLLSIDFVRLILFAFLIACPISWFAMHEWLQGFAYRIVVGAGIFLISGAGAILVALLTISIQAVRAAFTNPAESLRVM